MRAPGLAEQADTVRRSNRAPGPGRSRRLHLVSIGISDYGEHATKLKLAYAQKDARDVALR